MTTLSEQTIGGQAIPADRPTPRLALACRLSLDPDTHAPIVNYWDEARRINTWSHVSYHYPSDKPSLVSVEGPLGSEAFRWSEPEPISTDLAIACAPLLWAFLAEGSRPQGLYVVRWLDQLYGRCQVEPLVHAVRPAEETRRAPGKEKTHVDR